MTPIAKTICAISACVLSASVASADTTQTEALEAGYAIESDAVDRIKAADRLQMLTQRVAASSCALTSGVAPEKSLEVLRTAELEFDKLVHALQYGDESIHILGPETRRITLHDIEEVIAEWEPTRAAIEAVLADNNDVHDTHIIDDHNLPLLKLTQTLASDINSQYANPYEMSSTDALMITIAGRQRMLTQQMAKDACEIWTGYHSEEAKEDLAKIMQMFETSLLALRDGMPSAGLQPAPTPEIKADLDSILARWAVIKPNQLKLLDGIEIDMEAKVEIFHDLNVELEELEHLMQDYAAYTERAH